MTTKKNLVKQVLMSILTAGIFSFGFTACSDDLNGLGNNANDTEEGSDMIGNYADYEPYGLTYHNFDSADDVRILNADTTEIAVKKSLADKLGITNFVNHPLGIWDSPSHKAYGRKGLKQELVGDTYIIKVTGVTTAELLGVSQERLIRLFRNKSIYRTPEGYIDNLRTINAMRLLRTQPNYSIAAIAEASGFNHVRTLQRRIMDVTGMTPADYRALFTRDM